MPTSRFGSLRNWLFGTSPPPIDMNSYQGWGMPALWRPQESLDAYGDNPYLYRAVLMISMQIGQTAFRLQKTNAAGEIELVKKHQALATLAKPQPTAGGKSMLSAMLLKVVTGMHLMLNGEGFWLLLDRLQASGAPTRIKPLLSQNMVVDMTLDGEITGYRYRVDGREYRLDPMDVVHFKMPNPANFYRGHSPVKGIRFALDTHKEADVMNWKRLSNNAVPGGLLKPKQNLTEDQMKKLRAQFEQFHRGSENAGRLAVMPAEIEFQSVQQTNQEMQYAEGKAAARDDILAAYGVGPEMLGKTESQTRANAEAAIFVFQEFGVLPFLTLFNDTLNNDYLVAFPTEDGTEFAFPNPVPENMEEKRANADSLFQGGGITPNERRTMFGLEPLDLPGMDTPYLPFNLMPVGADPVAPNAPAEVPAA
jgi:HK97 family phage portal protein